MTGKEYLQQANRLNERITCKMSLLEEIRKMVFGIGSSSFEGHYNPNHPTEASFVRGVEKVSEIEESINADIDLLVTLKIQIYDVIDQVKDVDERLVLHYRYLFNWSWQKIGEFLKVNERTVRRWHSRALQHVVVPEEHIEI